MSDERTPSYPAEGVVEAEGPEPIGAATERLLSKGELSIAGRLVVASNATFLCEIALEDTEGDATGGGGIDGAGDSGAEGAANDPPASGDRSVGNPPTSTDPRLGECIYKPIRGERPLWDFPEGALAYRERAAYLLSQLGGCDLVPATVLRDGPLGPGMCQIWVDHDEDVDLIDVVPAEEIPPGWRRVLDAYDEEGAEVSLVHADDGELARLAVFDAVINNADRKAGHVLRDRSGRMYAVDHGVSLHAEPKLRTVLWGWAGEPLPEAALEMLKHLGSALSTLQRRSEHDVPDVAQMQADWPEVTELAGLLTAGEIVALRDRVDALRRLGRFPALSGNGPAIPWPVW